jgi:predicted nucleic acid-binding Zn ribbon protein
MKDEKLTMCPVCGMETLKRLIGSGGGLIFKGSGFYLTDYKNKSAEPPSTGTNVTKETTINAETKNEPTAIKTETESKPSSTKGEAESKSTSTKGNTTKKTEIKSTQTKSEK